MKSKMHGKYLSLVYIVCYEDNAMRGSRWCRSYQIANSISIVMREKVSKKGEGFLESLRPHRRRSFNGDARYCSGRASRSICS